MKGTCIDWDNTKDHGHIKGEDGNTYPCHFNAIQSQDTSLDVGEEITFEVGQELITKRPIAVMVRRANSG